LTTKARPATSLNSYATARVRKFTADDVVYTYETYQTAQTSKETYLADMAGVVAFGEHEVTFTLAQPKARWSEESGPMPGAWERRAAYFDTVVADLGEAVQQRLRRVTVRPIVADDRGVIGRVEGRGCR